MLFQFHKGAIGVSLLVKVFVNISNFNSIKVRLEYFQQVAYLHLQQNFNSIKVRLEYVPNYIKTAMQLNFNSIKVRLECL